MIFKNYLQCPLHIQVTVSLSEVLPPADEQLRFRLDFWFSLL